MYYVSRNQYGGKCYEEKWVFRKSAELGNLWYRVVFGLFKRVGVLNCSYHNHRGLLRCVKCNSVVRYTDGKLDFIESN